jgi:hypothetical protein
MAKIGGQYVNSSFVAMEANDHGYTEGSRSTLVAM